MKVYIVCVLLYYIIYIEIKDYTGVMRVKREFAMVIDL